jgi:hypothetical protein
MYILLDAHLNKYYVKDIKSARELIKKIKNTNGTYGMIFNLYKSDNLVKCLMNKYKLDQYHTYC